MAKEINSKKSNKKIQDAHEAIRPTDVNLMPEEVKDQLPRDLFRLYQLIWRRFVASRMENSVYETTNVKVNAGKYIFNASTSKLDFDGFMKVYTDSDNEKVVTNNTIAKLEKDSKLEFEKFEENQHFTQPPAHFTEAALVKAMEEQGIGRPSTYAPTITTIIARRYVTREKKNLYVTELGEAVNNVMKTEFSVIVDTQFTANMESLLDAVEDENIITVVQIAPAVRTAWGEGFGLSKDFATAKRLVAGLRRIGFDYIFDTTFSADLTIMEEGSELLERLPEIKESGLPMFTSCCPGWVNFIKKEYPQYVDRLSTAKSPQQMFGAVTKSYYAEKLGVEPERIFCVSLMPCLAKKDECTWDNGKDVDAVLTTREVERMLKSFFIKVQELEEEEFDDPLGVGSGAGVIFGATGGVMEAALRSAYYLVNKTNPEPDAFQCVRGLDGWKEAKFTINGNILKVAVASSLSNARKLMEAIATGKAHYDFVEVMACPGGCINGGGQPIKDDDNKVANRSKVLYGLDKVNNLRFSHENPSVMQCYKDYFGEPLSHKAHELLHISH
jgi:iron-only hydrogenase group A